MKRATLALVAAFAAVVATAETSRTATENWTRKRIGEATNATLQAAKDYTDQHGAAGMDTNAVELIANKAVRTNEVVVALVAATNDLTEAVATIPRIAESEANPRWAANADNASAVGDYDEQALRDMDVFIGENSQAINDEAAYRASGDTDLGERIFRTNQSVATNAAAIASHSSSLSRLEESKVDRVEGDIIDCTYLRMAQGAIIYLGNDGQLLTINGRPVVSMTRDDLPGGAANCVFAPTQETQMVVFDYDLSNAVTAVHAAATNYTDAATNAVLSSVTPRVASLENDVAAETVRATAAELSLQDQIDLFKSFQVIVTNSLPAVGEDGCVYLTPIAGQTNRIEWLWVHVPSDHWEMIGTTSIDMAQYYTRDIADGKFLPMMGDAESMEGILWVTEDRHKMLYISVTDDSYFGTGVYFDNTTVKFESPNRILFDGAGHDFGEGTLGDLVDELYGFAEAHGAAISTNSAAISTNSAAIEARATFDDVRHECQTVYADATNYTDAAISPANSAFSNAVLAVGLNFVTNEVTSATYIAATNVLSRLGFDEDVMKNIPGGEVYGSLGGLLAALAAAVAWLKRRTGEIETAVGTAKADLADALGNGEEVA